MRCHPLSVRLSVCGVWPHTNHGRPEGRPYDDGAGLSASTIRRKRCWRAFRTAWRTAFWSRGRLTHGPTRPQILLRLSSGQASRRAACGRQPWSALRMTSARLLRVLVRIHDAQEAVLAHADDGSILYKRELPFDPLPI